MSWIKDWAEGSFSLFSGNTVEAFQPLDFFHFYGLWYDLWVKQFLKAAEKLNAENKSYQELKDLLSTPSNMRAIIQKIIPAYLGTANPNKGEYARMANFFARMLMECCPNDPFGKTSNPFHTEKEVQEIYKQIIWKEGNPAIARKLGRLITAAGSLVHGLYNDVVTDFGWDAYGPYKINDQTLLIRDFPDLQPEDLWDKNFLAKIKSLKIYGLYKDVEWQINCVGCHTTVKNGSPITGLKKYAVVADGKYLTESGIDELIKELSDKAEKIYQEIRKKGFEELKTLVMLQECYQLKKFMSAAGLDWRPTNEMSERIINKPLLTGILPHGKIMTNVEEYKEIFGLRRFAKEVLNKTI